MKAFTNESERAAFEAQMLYGSHVFARAKVIPDLAIAKGREAHRYAKEIGDPNLEFLAAGGTAMAILDLGDIDEARAWIDRAAVVATEHPSPLRARRLETWRGVGDAAAGDAEGMRTHLERAVQQATDSGHAAARCEALARLAVESSRLGVRVGRRGADGPRGAIGGRGVGARRRRSPDTPPGEPRPTRHARGSRSPGGTSKRRRRSHAPRRTRCRPRGTRISTSTSCCRVRGS